MRLAILLAINLLFSVSSFAAVYSVRIDTSSTNTPANFGSGSDSRVLRNVPRVSTIVVDNATSSRLVINCTSDSVTPSDSSVNNIYVPATSQLAIDNANIGSTCYARGDTGAISSGIWTLMLVGG